MHQKIQNRPQYANDAADVAETETQLTLSGALPDSVAEASSHKPPTSPPSSRKYEATLSNTARTSLC
jgi:hypothetical protein